MAAAAAASVMFVGTTGSWAESAPQPKTQAAMVRDAVDEFILPRIDAFKTRANVLSEAVGEACRVEAKPAALAVAQSAFVETVRAWAPLDFVRFGPSARNHRLERVLFWPDPRATAERQLNTLLAARKPELLQPGALAKQSVAVQGLTALEALLFSEKQPLGNGNDEAARYRCDMARAVASAIDTVAGEIQSGWAGEDGYRAKILNPGPENRLYRDTSESAREIAKALVVGFDLVRDRIALPELHAVSRDPPRRARLPFERSNATGVFVIATIDALKELYDVCAFAARIGPDKPWMVGFLSAGWNGLATESRRLDDVRAGDIASKAHRHVANKLRFDITSIRQIVVRELAANAGIILGFNELDGD
ncbi:hypothetical protein W911_16415 [Hyphomicrobium nitrativorans NL23]|uniref:Imelysin-like domain-containing protein n=1 Tax=Hyphomicrobium nitrativorans NL23 TaxID=1029756 RepID=V5SKB8_9HYPH|nr:imelysin family protein [Hyphomicrobium nitrativorans]AHB50414.1 hypothetical protein W911_16415 [Hyphomicrobium nitrativorans NL23]